MLAIEYHVHIWQVLPQLSCGDTYQIWIWLQKCNSYFCYIENFAYGENDERSFSNPRPWGQAITGTNDDADPWRIYASRGLNIEIPTYLHHPPSRSQPAHCNGRSFHNPAFTHSLSWLPPATSDPRPKAEVLTISPRDMTLNVNCRPKDAECLKISIVRLLTTLHDEGVHFKPSRPKQILRQHIKMHFRE